MRPRRAGRTAWKRSEAGVLSEDEARRVEPEERRKREAGRRGSPEHAGKLAEAAERRRSRHPVREDGLPPLGLELQTHAGCVVFEAVTGKVVDPPVAARFYLGLAAATGTLVWTTRRRATHEELVQAWSARAAPEPAELARGWWRSTIEVLREERRRAAFLERAQATRRSRDGKADAASAAGR